MSDADLKGLIVELTGNSKTAQVTKLTLGTFKALKGLAEFSDIAELEVVGPEPTESAEPVERPATLPETITVASGSSRYGESLNLSYTINLNLPPTSDVEVFNAIFGALKEHLLK